MTMEALPCPRRVSSQTVLEVLQRRRSLTPRQTLAALRLRRSYSVGVAGMHLQEPARSPRSATNALEGTLGASEDFRRARDALGRLWPTVEGVVCEDRPVSEVASLHRGNPMAAMGVLRVALDVLADHYRLP